MWASTVAIVVCVGLAVVLPDDVERLSMRERNVLLALVGWNIFVILYVVMSHRTFARVDKDEFLRRMAARSDRRARFWRWLSPGGDGPNFAIESAAVAFFVVLVVPRIQVVALDPWLLVPVTLSILLSCWALAIVSYALHYAERDIAEPSLEFPGDRTGAYADYLYFSIAVATTFGATDVNITKPAMRRAVNLHTILTFVYNSVIVAVLASMLIR